MPEIDLPTGVAIPVTDGIYTRPSVVLTGPYPEAGEPFTFLAENGVAYTGIASIVEPAGEERCVVFIEGDLTPDTGAH